jgi:glycylpeptide N-tetradecanoyltransferase
MLDLKNAMRELGYDSTSPDFSEERMIMKFKQLSED